MGSLSQRQYHPYWQQGIPKTLRPSRFLCEEEEGEEQKLTSMAFPALPKLLLLLVGFFIIFLGCSDGVNVRAQVEETMSLNLMTEALEWPSMETMYDEFGEEESEDGGNGIGMGRRSLFWRRVIRYYISYGALSANRIPCPPRSGRSYYTHNCYKARGPVHPYTRGCSRITRCRI